MDMRGGDVVKDADGGKQQFSDVSEGMQLLQRIRVYSFIQFLRLVFVAPSDGKVDGGRTLAFISLLHVCNYAGRVAEKLQNASHLSICCHRLDSLSILHSPDSNFVRIRRRLTFRHELRQRARDLGEAEAVGRPDGWWGCRFILFRGIGIGIGLIERQKQEAATSKGRGMDEQEHVQQRREG